MITYNKLRKNISAQLNEIHTKTYTVIGVTFLTVFVLITFAIRPVVFSLSDEIGQVSDLQTVDDQIKTNLSNLASDITSYNQNISGNEPIVSLAMPKSAQTGVLFANINALADSNHVQISSLQFLHESDVTAQNSFGQSLSLSSQYTVANAQKLYFILNGEGKLSDMDSFVGSLEGFPRVINISEVNMNASIDKSGAITTTDFTIKGYVYYLM